LDGNQEHCLTRIRSWFASSPQTLAAPAAAETLSTDCPIDRIFAKTSGLPPE